MVASNHPTRMLRIRLFLSVVVTLTYLVTAWWVSLRLMNINIDVHLCAHEYLVGLVALFVLALTIVKPHWHCREKWLVNFLIMYTISLALSWWLFSHQITTILANLSGRSFWDKIHHFIVFGSPVQVTIFSVLLMNDSFSEIPRNVSLRENSHVLHHADLDYPGGIQAELKDLGQWIDATLRGNPSPGTFRTICYFLWYEPLDGTLTFHAEKYLKYLTRNKKNRRTHEDFLSDFDQIANFFISPSNAATSRSMKGPLLHKFVYSCDEEDVLYEAGIVLLTKLGRFIRSFELQVTTKTPTIPDNLFLNEDDSGNDTRHYQQHPSITEFTLSFRPYEPTSTMEYGFPFSENKCLMRIFPNLKHIRLEHLHMHNEIPWTELNIVKAFRQLALSLSLSKRTPLNELSLFGLVLNNQEIAVAIADIIPHIEFLNMLACRVRGEEITKQTFLEVALGPKQSHKGLLAEQRQPPLHQRCIDDDGIRVTAANLKRLVCTSVSDGFCKALHGALVSNRVPPILEIVRWRSTAYNQRLLPQGLATNHSVKELVLHDRSERLYGPKYFGVQVVILLGEIKDNANSSLQTLRIIGREDVDPGAFNYYSKREWTCDAFLRIFHDVIATKKSIRKLIYEIYDRKKNGGVNNNQGEPFDAAGVACRYPVLNLDDGNKVLRLMRENYNLIECPFVCEASGPVSERIFSVNDVTNKGEIVNPDRIMSQTQIYLDLNAAGRGRIIHDQNSSKEEWAKLLFIGSNCVDVLFELLVLNPTLCDRRH